MVKNRIKELRQSQNETLIGLMRRVNATLNENKVTVNNKPLTITDSQLSFYENGKRSPRNEEIWEALSKVFHVSVPYIKGDSDHTTSDEASVTHLKKNWPSKDGTRLMVESRIIRKYGEKALERIKKNISDEVIKDTFFDVEYSEYDNFIHSIDTLFYIRKDFFDVVVLLASLDDKKQESIISFIKNMID